MAGRRAPVRSSARLSNSGAVAAASSGGRQAGERAAAAAARRARAAERAREVEDSPSELRDKCRRLARALMNAKHLVVYTGAGISTAADIPDYRGPHGVWTRLQRGEAVGRVEVARARPTFTHMALTALWARGTLKFVVSQNCDGLHVRAGMPRRALAELHGDMFAERCEPCRRVYLRAFDTTERTARHAHGTRRLCHACGAELQDTIVHFGERGRAAWPLNWAGALRHAAAADVVLCLGSSLKVLRRYPRLWRMQSAPHARPDLYVVNLQWTPKDAVAKMKINARCDAVMAQVARRLRLRVPRYSPRRDPLLAHAEPLLPHEAHTSRRRALRAPAPAPAACASSSASSSGSDSDDEVPLRSLADRLRVERLDQPPAALRALPQESPRVPFLPVQSSGPISPVTTTMRELPQSPPSCATPALISKPPPELPEPRDESWPVSLPDLLHAFQVNMKSGDATILLRAEHVPSVPTAPTRPLPLPPCPALPRAPSELRRFRMARAPLRAPALHALTNGHAPPAANGAWGCVRLRRLLQCEARPCARDTPPDRDRNTPAVGAETEFRLNVNREEKPKIKNADEYVKPRADVAADAELKMDVDYKSKIKINLDPAAKNGFDFDLKPDVDFHPHKKADVDGPTKAETESGGESGSESERGLGAARALAAALIARAVLACRAQLYPGLHSIIAPEPSACAWCARHYAARGARRCLWYGPPALTPPARRAARRVRLRRYLCACCGPGAAGASGHAARDDSGWYGKGYRKGRRRPRP